MYRWIFLSLAKATVRHVITANDCEIVVAMKNFKLAGICEDRDENTRVLLLYLFRELIRDTSILKKPDWK
jgi:hypothetical protein